MVESTVPDMRSAIRIAGSDSYPTARPICDQCLALLSPILVKGIVPACGVRGSGGGGGKKS